MKRNAWKRNSREQRDPDRARSMPTVTPGAFRAPQPVATAPAPVPNVEPIRCKAYLRLVAQLPCKACDLQTFPLCADRPGQRGCHSQFDQGALFGKEARRQIERAWVADTQRQIHAMGIWPKKYPFRLTALDGQASAAIKSEAL